MLINLLFANYKCNIVLPACMNTIIAINVCIAIVVVYEECRFIIVSRHSFHIKACSVLTTLAIFPRDGAPPRATLVFSGPVLLFE